MPNLTCGHCKHTGPDVSETVNRWGTRYIACDDAMACWWRWDTAHGLTVMTLEEYRLYYRNALKGWVTA